MSKIWSIFSEAADVARSLALKRNEYVEIVRCRDGWVIPSYVSWTGELDESDLYELPSERRASYGLVAPDWEDGTSNEVDDGYAGYYLENWDSE